MDESSLSIQRCNNAPCFNRGSVNNQTDEQISDVMKDALKDNSATDSASANLASKQTQQVNLPDEIWLFSFYKIDFKKLPTAASVCKQFKKCARSEKLWSVWYRRDFPTAFLPNHYLPNHYLPSDHSNNSLKQADYKRQAYVDKNIFNGKHNTILKTDCSPNAKTKAWWSPKGDMLAVLADHEDGVKLHFWQPPSKEPKLTMGFNYIRGLKEGEVAFSPDQSMIALANFTEDNYIALFNLENGQLVKQIFVRQHSSPPNKLFDQFVSNLTWSPNQQFLGFVHHIDLNICNFHCWNVQSNKLATTFSLSSNEAKFDPLFTGWLQNSKFVVIMGKSRLSSIDVSVSQFLRPRAQIWSICSNPKKIDDIIMISSNQTNYRNRTKMINWRQLSDKLETCESNPLLSFKDAMAANEIVFNNNSSLQPNPVGMTWSVKTLTNQIKFGKLQKPAQWSLSCSGPGPSLALKQWSLNGHMFAYNPEPDKLKVIDFAPQLKMTTPL